MTIRDIAKLAGVSVSTVSKIINKKDESISEETRERVLAVVREHNYAPYRDRITSQAHLLGAMLPAAASQDFLSAVVEGAREHGYGTVVCTSSDAEEEKENAQLLCQHGVSGVLWFRGDFSTEAVKETLTAQEIPVVVMDECGEDADVTLPWKELGAFVGETFTAQGHERIGCVLGTQRVDAQQLLTGLHTAMLPTGHICTREDCFPLNSIENNESLAVWLREHTAVLCTDEQAAEAVLNTAESLGYQIPGDLSVIMFQRNNAGRSRTLSSLLLPFFLLGRLSVDRLTGQLKNHTIENAHFPWKFTLEDRISISYPRANDRKKIVVVGTINADNLISVEKYPELGETVAAQGCFFMPGGKGLNQALAVSRLEQDACLIAKVGRDYEGRTIGAFLKNSHVVTDGVSVVENAPTGKAYIFTQNDGESSISVLKGANALLTPEDVAAQETLFAGASYCLLQTEMDVEVVERAMDLARSHGVRTILKPCAIDTLTPQILEKTDLLIPNQKEAAKLLPQIHSVEEQAEQFCQMGAGQVIITMGAKGCYWYDGAEGTYFPAEELETVDTTGAADGFIAALAVSLAEGRPMESALRYATAAAGLSTLRYGFSAAAVDKNTLELYCAQKGVVI